MEEQEEIVLKKYKIRLTNPSCGDKIGSVANETQRRSGSGAILISAETERNQKNRIKKVLDMRAEI
ncbi:hypothetical protein [[Clostridium] aminophilum]|uniref:hypothetical protein n=1 Tax=[Clostridium] aminophilum TaxID=1526 RepID=UPI0015A61008|nr:hypothetical protein [[Clostridium] aminophilum]